MGMEDLPKIIAALAFFGAIVICPLVYVFLKHQRSIAELVHGRASDESQRRIEALEREVRELRALHHRQLISEDDRQDLARRIP